MSKSPSVADVRSGKVLEDVMAWVRVHGTVFFHLDYARSFAAHHEWSGEGAAVDSHSLLRFAGNSHLVVSHCRA